jgi:hypothetical protein
MVGQTHIVEIMDDVFVNAVLSVNCRPGFFVNGYAT